MAIEHDFYSHVAAATVAYMQETGKYDIDIIMQNCLAMAGRFDPQIVTLQPGLLRNMFMERVHKKIEQTVRNVREAAAAARANEQVQLALPMLPEEVAQHLQLVPAVFLIDENNEPITVLEAPAVSLIEQGQREVEMHKRLMAVGKAKIRLGKLCGKHANLIQAYSLEHALAGHTMGQLT